MAEVIQDIQHLLKKGQHIAYHHSGGNEVYLDPSMMKHIVTNLLSNAIKFSPENTPIELDTENKGQKLILSVADHGLGIPKEDQENLFKRFFRSSNVTNIQGTGLGLHIVNKYAELMGGKTICQSEEGKGTKFIITFMHKQPKNENDINN
jgi:signal transduction histidine kinase